MLETLAYILYIVLCYLAGYLLGYFIAETITNYTETGSFTHV